MYSSFSPVLMTPDFIRCRPRRGPEPGRGTEPKLEERMGGPEAAADDDGGGSSPTSLHGKEQ
jgi:hypothetical protein